MPDQLRNEKLHRVFGDHTTANLVAFALAALLAIVSVTSNGAYTQNVPGASITIVVSVLLAVAMFPRVFNKLPGPKRIYLSGLAVIAVLFQLISPGGTDMSPAPAPVDIGGQQAEAGKIKACFGTFSGTIDALRDQIKNGLDDPSSFELVRTDVDQALGRNVTMTFRAKNRFDATVLATVDAQVNPDTCAIEAVDQPKVD